MSKYHILAIIQDDVRLPERRLIQVFRAQGLSHFIYGIIHLGPKTDLAPVTQRILVRC